MNTRAILSRSPFLMVFVFIILLGCSFQQNTKNIDISKNAELREKVYQQILSDKDLFNGFMNKMMSNNNAMTWMMNHQGMMHSMYSDKNLNYYMHHHDGNANMMMENISNVICRDTVLLNHWQRLMKDHPDRHHMMMRMK